MKLNGFALELDGYCKKLGIAFEHQGDQHYMDLYRGKSTDYIKEKDRFKVKFCKENEIKLIVIRDIINHYKNDSVLIKKALEDEFKRLKIIIPPSFYSIEIEIISPADNKWTYEKLLEIAKNYSDKKSLIANVRGAEDFILKLKLSDRLHNDLNWVKKTSKPKREV
jgi:hypothetical protein